MNTRLRIFNYSLIGMLIILASIFVIQENRNKKELNKEKHAGSILNENNEKLKKEIAVLHNDFNKNSKHFADMISENEKTISENKAKIQGLLNENRSGENAKRKLKNLESTNLVLQKDLDVVKNQYEQLFKQSDMLNNQIADLITQNSQLKDQLEIIKNLHSDNISISAKKGKRNKLTVIAARTNLISATLDIPAASSYNLHYAVEFPGGTKLQSTDMPFSEIKLLPASGEDASGNETKSALIKFEPRQKLKKGIYKLLVYNGNDYLTGMYINLK